jgi:hypothetical protein
MKYYQFENDGWNGKFDYIPFYKHTMKETKYIASVISTNRPLDRTEEETEDLSTSRDNNN